MAWFRREPAEGVVFYSARGSQCASRAMSAKLIEYGMAASMSCKGNCWGNVPRESFFNGLKKLAGCTARATLRGPAEAALFQYIDVFDNRSRRHSTLGYNSPIQLLQDWISKHDDHPSKAA